MYALVLILVLSIYHVFMTIPIAEIHVILIFQNIPAKSAAFLISIIGITNTIGRVICGYIADLPWVDSLFLNNVCLLVSSISVAATPFCHTYTQFVLMAIFFGIAICK